MPRLRPVNNRFLLVRASLPLQNLSASDACHEHPAIADDPHFEVFARKIQGKHAKMQRASDVIFVLETHGRMVMNLVGPFEDAVDGATAKSGDPHGSRSDPPVHEIKVVAIL